MLHHNRDPFLLLRVSFQGRPIFMQFIPGEEDEEAEEDGPRSAGGPRTTEPSREEAEVAAAAAAEEASLNRERNDGVDLDHP